MKILITGGAGFIGSNFVHYWLREHADDSVVVIDKLTYAGNMKNLSGVMSDARFHFFPIDVATPKVAVAIAGSDVVVHFAAESHVDRSILNADDFVRTNVQGTLQLLEACRRNGVARFVQVSTDEVYGSLGAQGKFTESSPLAPSSPYAASKAAGDLLALSYVRTHRFPAIVTRCSNNYGPYQFPEKFIPLMISQALADEPLPIYGDGQNVRDWIHVQDHCKALDAIIQHGREGEVYNIGGECEQRNLDVAYTILDMLGKPRSLIQFVLDRPGHDRHYAIHCDKVKSTVGWQQQWDFASGLKETIRWYRENGEWLNEIQSGGYRDYFEKHYVRRNQMFAKALQHEPEAAVGDR
jgi:dTDP-glucose 4,6-dehydratase